MNAEFQKTYDRIEMHRKALLAEIRQLSDEQLRFRPAEGSWSILEVVQHLLLAEEAFTGYAAKKSNAPPERVSIVSRFLYAGVDLVLKSSLKVKAPSDLVIPKEPLPLSNLEPRWEKSRKQLQQVLEAIPQERAGAILFKHPIAGKLDAVRGLGFLESHVAHHKIQIGRIQNASGFPKSADESA